MGTKPLARTAGPMAGCWRGSARPAMTPELIRWGGKKRNARETRGASSFWRGRAEEGRCGGIGLGMFRGAPQGKAPLPGTFKRGMASAGFLLPSGLTPWSALAREGCCLHPAIVRPFALPYPPLPPPFLFLWGRSPAACRKVGLFSRDT